MRDIPKSGTSASLYWVKVGEYIACKECEDIGGHEEGPQEWARRAPEPAGKEAAVHRQWETSPGKKSDPEEVCDSESGKVCK